MAESLRDWTQGAPRLLLWRCDACRHATALPHVGCPSCGGASVIAAEAGNAGSCIARTALPAGTSGEQQPSVMVLVGLDSGVVVMAVAAMDVHVGDRVRARFARVGDRQALVPVFAREACHG